MTARDPRWRLVTTAPPLLAPQVAPPPSATARPGVVWAYLGLGKPRLSALVVLSAVFGYALGADALLGDPRALAGVVGGTALTSVAANAFNQYLEFDTDLLMQRTRWRAIPAGDVTPARAFAFAMATGTLGIVWLSLETTPLVAGLALANITLYALVYTPAKRLVTLNTWLGAIVGAVPPLMGYASTGRPLDVVALTAAALLFAWQIPHFFALSHRHGSDYRRANYAMLSCRAQPRALAAQHLAMVAVVTAIIPVAYAASETCTAWAVVEVAPFSALYLHHALKFFRDTTLDHASRCFRFSLIWLPVAMLALAVHRQDPSPVAVVDDDRGGGGPAENPAPPP